MHSFRRSCRSQKPSSQPNTRYRLKHLSHALHSALSPKQFQLERQSIGALSTPSERHLSPKETSQTVEYFIINTYTSLQPNAIIPIVQPVVFRSPPLAPLYAVWCAILYRSCCSLTGVMSWSGHACRISRYAIHPLRSLLCAQLHVSLVHSTP